MICSNCSAEVQMSAKFCSACGTPIAPVPPQAAPSEPEPTATRKSPWLTGWLFLVGVLLVPIYLNMLVFALAGRAQLPNVGTAATFWTGLFGVLWWQRIGRPKWHGALLGALAGILLFVLAAFIGGYLGRANLHH